MTCDEARERLAEHVLGTLEGADDLEVRRHLRGCVSCRTDMAALGDGLILFSRAAHDRTPPPELRERVLTVLEEEWRDSTVEPPGRHVSRFAWIAAAAALLVLAVSWGVVQTDRASRLEASAASYDRILNVLGGEDFRIGTLNATGPQAVQGSVVLYDAHTDQSWGLVIVHAPGMSGTAHATLTTRDGREIALTPLKFDAEGDASSWLVSTADLTSFDRLTVEAADGTTVATSKIVSA